MRYSEEFKNMVNSVQKEGMYDGHVETLCKEMLASGIPYVGIQKSLGQCDHCEFAITSDGGMCIDECTHWNGEENLEITNAGFECPYFKPT